MAEEKPANDNLSKEEEELRQRIKAGWAELGFHEPRTENGNPIVHLKETEWRTEADGTEKRMHLGYSVEGFHAAIETTENGYATDDPYNWGKAHPTANAATEAAWKTVLDSEGKLNTTDSGKLESMPDIPDHVKAQADAEVAQTGVQKMPVKDMDAPPAVDNYGDRGKELEALREQKRQDAVQEKTPDPNQPDKG